jgi:hypothetical protein
MMHKSRVAAALALAEFASATNMNPAQIMAQTEVQ